MGCWSENCAISGMEIQDGQRVYGFTVRREKLDTGYGPNIVIPPIMGTYDDYGAMDLLESNTEFGLKQGDEWSPHRIDYPDDTDFHLVFIDAEVFEWLYDMEPEWDREDTKTLGGQLEHTFEKIRDCLKDNKNLEIDEEMSDDVVKVTKKWMAEHRLTDIISNHYNPPYETAGYKDASALMDGRIDVEEFLKFWGRASLIKTAFMELRKTIPTHKTYAPQHGGYQALIPFYEFVLEKAKARRNRWEEDEEDAYLEE